MAGMKKNYSTREEMERDQGRIMKERMKELQGGPKHRVTVGDRSYTPKKKK